MAAAAGGEGIIAMRTMNKDKEEMLNVVKVCTEFLFLVYVMPYYIVCTVIFYCCHVLLHYECCSFSLCHPSVISFLTVSSTMCFCVQILFSCFYKLS